MDALRRWLNCPSSMSISRIGSGNGCKETCFAHSSLTGRAGWEALKRGVLELVERLVSHIQKEEMALLPLLDDLLDDETDRQLAFAYAAG